MFPSPWCCAPNAIYRCYASHVDDKAFYHFNSLLPIAFSPNLSMPLDICCLAKPISPTLPDFRSNLYLLRASRRWSAVNGPRLFSFDWSSLSDGGGDCKPVCDSPEASSHCNCTFLADSMISPAKILVTDLTARMTLAGTDCESV